MSPYAASLSLYTYHKRYKHCRAANTAFIPPGIFFIQGDMPSYYLKKKKGQGIRGVGGVNWGKSELKN